MHTGVPVRAGLSRQKLDEVGQRDFALGFMIHDSENSAKRKDMHSINTNHAAVQRAKLGRSGPSVES